MGICITSGCTRSNQPPCLFCKECFDPPLEVWDKWAREEGFSSWKEKEGQMGIKKSKAGVFYIDEHGNQHDVEKLIEKLRPFDTQRNAELETLQAELAALKLRRKGSLLKRRLDDGAGLGPRMGSNKRLENEWLTQIQRI